MSPVKILVIDDEDSVRIPLMKLLSLEGYEVSGAVNGAEGLDAFKQLAPQVVVSDIRMPIFDGIEVLTRIMESAPATIVIMITGYGDDGFHDLVLKLGARDYFEKPVAYEELLSAIKDELGSVDG